MKVIRAIAGTLVGYLISLSWSLAWFFKLTHHDPWLPASPGYIAVTALLGIVISGIAGYAGAAIARGWERGAGEAIAILIMVMCEWSWWESPGQSHWSQAVAIFLMGPAALLGAWLLAGRRRLGPAANR
jgi:hypothetical protein